MNTIEQENPVEINGLLVDEWTILDADPEDRLESDTPNFRKHTFVRTGAGGGQVEVTFQPQQLRSGEIVVIETMVSRDHLIHSHLHEYVTYDADDDEHVYNPNGWKSHITEKGNWMVSRGDVKTSHERD